MCEREVERLERGREGGKEREREGKIERNSFYDNCLSGKSIVYYFRVGNLIVMPLK